MKPSVKSARLVRRSCFAVGVSVLMTACASGPKPKDWQLEAKTATERSTTAYLEGNSRVEAVEFARVRAEISSTGRADLMARAELLRCAAHVASLAFETCQGFEKLRLDALPAERAYADYLQAKLLPQDAALLPEPQRAAFINGEAAIKSMTDPLSQLVAAGVALQLGRASPDLVQMAVDTASVQGWRRPLLAWLGVQLALSEKPGSGQTPEDAARLRRRIDLVLGGMGNQLKKAP